MNIVLATRNRKKAEEIRRITIDLPITIQTLDDHPGCPETIEDRDTFEGNAIKKAKEVSDFTGMVALADDSGLEVDALNGAPGVYSARYAGPECNDRANFEKLLAELREIPHAKRTARFVCCIALAFPGRSVNTFFGFVNGHIALEPKGKTGFGYDPVFVPDGHETTFAEMSGNDKDKLSHRGKAIVKLAEFLHSKLDL